MQKQQLKAMRRGLERTELAARRTSGAIRDLMSELMALNEMLSFGAMESIVIEEQEEAHDDGGEL